jgi:hypothetical protein
MAVTFLKKCIGENSIQNQSMRLKQKWYGGKIIEKWYGATFLKKMVWGKHFEKMYGCNHFDHNLTKIVKSCPK